MDEPTTSQPEYDVASDGAAYSGYEEETLPPAPDAAPEIAADGVKVSDGDLKFGEEFFGDLKDSADEAPAGPKTDAPKWYTDDELKSTPFEQWDISRLNGDVGKYARIVQEQYRQRNVQRQVQAVQEAPMPPEIVEVKQYTPKELADESLKLACEKLGLEDADDFDQYEGEHRAAYELASQELLQKRNAEIAGYQQALQGWEYNKRFQAELARQPDIKEFDEWCRKTIQDSGYTLEQVQAGLNRRVHEAGGNYGVIAQIIGGWYNEFRQKKAQSAPKPRRESSPAVLEGSQGSGYGGMRRVNARDFGSMTPDEQAQALIKMGVV